MKTFSIKLFVVLSFGLLLFSFGCKQDSPSLNDMNIEVCGIKSPEWIKKEVHSITSRTHKFIPVKVSVCKDSDKEIILIEDGTNSNMAENIRFFECTGYKVPFNSAEYNAYFQKFRQGNFLLLWSN